MEVGYHCVDHMELVTRKDEEAGCLSVARQDFARFGVPCRLQAATLVVPMAITRPPLVLVRLMASTVFFGNGVALGVNLVIFRELLVNDAEGVQANLQMHGFPIDALCLDALNELGREMEACGGRGGAALFSREYRLIQLFIACVNF